MSLAARDWAWSCRGLTLAMRCILLALAEHADEEGRCWPSLTRLAALTEADRRTVTRGLAELEARGLLARDRRRGKGTRYTLAIGRPSTEVLPTEPPDPPDSEVTPLSQTNARARGVAPLNQGNGTPGGVTPPGARDHHCRGVTPLYQGCDTPRDMTPQGARGPQGRDVTPLGRGERPPNPGASDPPNRHKNRHRTESEPSLCGDDTAPPEKSRAHDSRKGTLIPPDWRPGERVFDWAAKRGMNRTWVETQIEEFLVYWSDTGERRKSWDATFINRLQALQANQPRDQAREPEPRLADKDYLTGATPLDQIPWLDPATFR
jgi:DNA-binding transcriptional ArsR family regulator